MGKAEYAVKIWATKGKESRLVTSTISLLGGDPWSDVMNHIEMGKIECDFVICSIRYNGISPHPADIRAFKQVECTSIQVGPDDDKRDFTEDTIGDIIAYQDLYVGTNINDGAFWAAAERDIAVLMRLLLQGAEIGCRYQDEIQPLIISRGTKFVQDHSFTV
jgi:hypothetical protein